MTKQITFLTTLATFLLSLPLVANANTWRCPFTDYFAINSSYSAKIFGEPKIEGYLVYTRQSETSFILSCRAGGPSGDITMDIGFDKSDRCTLILHDGPYVVNPSVTIVKCTGGIYFKGLDHLMGSHNYTLKFGG